MCRHLSLQEGERLGPVRAGEPGRDDEEEGAPQTPLALPQGTNAPFTYDLCISGPPPL